LFYARKLEAQNILRHCYYYDFLSHLGLFIGVLFTLVLAGCDGQRADTLRITGWISTPVEETLMRSMIDAFERRHPGSAVHYEPITANYMDKLLLMLGTRTAPDIVMLEAFWAPALVAYDTLMPLDKFVAQDPDFAIEDFEPALLNAFRFNGELYGLPKDYSTLVLYYNLDMFAEAGLKDPPRTWDEFADYARRLTRDTDGDGLIDQYGYGHAEALEYSLPFVWQNQGEYFDKKGEVSFTDPAFVEALAFLQQLKARGIAVLPTDVGAAWNMDAFGRKRVAMVLSGLWAVNFMKETYPQVPYKVAPLPVGKQAASVAFVVSYAMPKHTSHPNQAWQLLRYLTSREGQLIWAQADVGLPPRRSIAQSFSLERDALKSTFIQSLKHARPWQLGVNHRIMDETQTALQAIFLTDAPIEPTLERLRHRIEGGRLPIYSGRASLDRPDRSEFSHGRAGP
jgi:multiple sugar transport system substrate-binding protein